MVRWVLGPRGELITVVLLNEDRIKSNPDGLLLYLWIRVSLSPHQRSFLLRQMAIDTEIINTTGQGTENKRSHRVLSPKRDIWIAQCFLGLRGQWHTWLTVIVTIQVRHECTRSSWAKSHHRGRKKSQNSPLNWGAISNWWPLGLRESGFLVFFFFRNSALERLSMLQQMTYTHARYWKH